MGRLCAVTIANERYQDYVPLYLAAWRFAYPEAGLRVYSEGEFRPEVERALDALGSGCTVLRHPRRDHLDSQCFKCWRWLLDDPEFERYEYLHIGDVDVLPLPGTASLLELHAQECRKTGLPYSNNVRPCGQRLTGMHFVNVAGYFPRMRPVMDKYRSWLERPPATLVEALPPFRNERLLHRMVEEAGLGFPRYRTRRIHGIHLRGCVAPMEPEELDELQSWSQPLSELCRWEPFLQVLQALDPESQALQQLDRALVLCGCPPRATARNRRSS